MERFGICRYGAWGIPRWFMALKFLAVLVEGVCDFARLVLWVLALAMDSPLGCFEILNLAAVLSGVWVSPKREVNLE